MPRAPKRRCRYCTGSGRDVSTPWDPAASSASYRVPRREDPNRNLAPDPASVAPQAPENTECRGFLERVLRHWLPEDVDPRPWPSRFGYAVPRELSYSEDLKAEFHRTGAISDAAREDYFAAVRRARDWYIAKGKTDAALRRALEWDDELKHAEAVRARAQAAALDAARRLDASRAEGGADTSDGWAATLDANLREGWPAPLAAVLSRRMLSDALARVEAGVKPITTVDLFDTKGTADFFAFPADGMTLADFVAGMAAVLPDDPPKTTTVYDLAQRLQLKVSRGKFVEWRMTPAEAYELLVALMRSKAKKEARANGALECGSCGREAPKLITGSCFTCYQRARRKAARGK